MAPPRKLTMETVRFIRSLFREGIPLHQICRDFNISKSLAQDIKSGMAYREEEKPSIVHDGRPAWAEGREIGERARQLTADMLAKGEKVKPMDADASSSPEDMIKAIAAANAEAAAKVAAEAKGR